MKLEELIRVHGNIATWLGSEAGRIFEVGFEPPELADLTKFIPTPQNAARTLVPFLELPEELAAHAGRLTVLSTYAQFDLQTLRSLPVSSKEELIALMRGGDRNCAVFNNLSLPFEKDAREFIKIIGGEW